MVLESIKLPKQKKYNLNCKIYCDGKHTESVNY